MAHFFKLAWANLFHHHDWLTAALQGKFTILQWPQSVHRWVNTKSRWTLQFVSHLPLLYLAYNVIITSFVTFAPKSQPAPRGLIAHVSTSSGSDQTRSQKAPLWGISWLRSMVRIWSSVLMSGERPPWTQRICSSINWRKRDTCAKHSIF